MYLSVRIVLLKILSSPNSASVQSAVAATHGVAIGLKEPEQAGPRCASCCVDTCEQFGAGTVNRRRKPRQDEEKNRHEEMNIVADT